MIAKFWARAKTFVRTHQLAAFVGLALIFTFAMTAVGLNIYVSSGTIKLDLSRPGYEKVRKNVQKSADQSEEPFQTSGNIDAAALKDFDSRFEKLQVDLKNSGNFGSSMSDQSLRLE